jgi:hypothetical protein
MNSKQTHRQRQLSALELKRFYALKSVVDICGKWGCRTFLFGVMLKSGFDPFGSFGASPTFTSETSGWGSGTDPPLRTSPAGP